MSIELDLPGIRASGRNGLRTVRVGDVSEAVGHIRGSILTMVDIDRTSFNGKEANLASLREGSTRMVRYSSRIPVSEYHLLARIARYVGRFSGRNLQAWPFITPSFQQQAEAYATDPGIYGVSKLLLPARLQGRAWREATKALVEGPVSVVGNSRFTDERFVRALHRYAVKTNLGDNRVTFVHVKP